MGGGHGYNVYIWHAKINKKQNSLTRRKKTKNQITARKKKENKQKLMIFVNRFDQITDKLQITD